MQGSGDPFLSYTLRQTHKIWRQIAPTFGLRLLEMLQMIEHALACCVSDKEEVAILHCCLGGESVLGAPGRLQAGTQRSPISAPTQQ